MLIFILEDVFPFVSLIACFNQSDQFSSVCILFARRLICWRKMTLNPVCPISLQPLSRSALLRYETKPVSGDSFKEPFSMFPVGFEDLIYWKFLTLQLKLVHMECSRNLFKNVIMLRIGCDWSIIIIHYLWLAKNHYLLIVTGHNLTLRRIRQLEDPIMWLKHRQISMLFAFDCLNLCLITWPWKEVRSPFYQVCENQQPLSTLNHVLPVSQAAFTSVILTSNINSGYTNVQTVIWISEGWEVSELIIVEGYVSYSTVNFACHSYICFYFTTTWTCTKQKFILINIRGCCCFNMSTSVLLHTHRTQVRFPF